MATSTFITFISKLIKSIKIECKSFMNLIKLLLLLFIGIIKSLKHSLYLHFIGCFHNNIISTGQFVPCDKNLFSKLLVRKCVNDGVVKRRRFGQNGCDVKLPLAGRVFQRGHDHKTCIWSPGK